MFVDLIWARLLDTELKHYSFTLTQIRFANSFPANSAIILIKISCFWQMRPGGDNDRALLEPRWEDLFFQALEEYFS